MPAYNYHCVACGAADLRIAGLDDHVAVCVDCGGMMLRTDDDLFAPYFAGVRGRPRQISPILAKSRPSKARFRGKG